MQRFTFRKHLPNYITQLNFEILMDKFTQLLFVLPLFLFSACESDGESNDQLSKAEPIILKSAYAEKVKQDNNFAFDLLRTTVRASEEPNTFISPLSVSMALSMTLNGAQGQTAEEMKQALRASDYTMDEINDYNQTLREALLKVDPSTQLGIANSIWAKHGFPVKETFTQTNRDYYDAEVRTEDFSVNTVKLMNQWCSDKTKEKIPEIIKEIPSDAVLYLINAVYFKGIWISQFKKNQTKKESFLAENGQSKEVEMMHQEASFNHATDDQAAYLELPYGNQAFSMVVMLPNEGKSTQDVLEHLNPSIWNGLSFIGKTVNLKLPRFKIELEYQMEKKILPDMGMKLPFVAGADFRGIADAPLNISQVIHKTFLDVNEEGTEAAAATLVGIEFTTAPSTPQRVDFIVNRPFVFLIRENSTGVILFAGKIGNL